MQLGFWEYKDVTIILIAFIIVCAYNRIKCELSETDIFLIIVSLVDLCLIWYRTYKLTGILANSIWGAFFSMLGLKEKYPLGTTSISQIKDNIFSQDVILHTLTRVKEFLCQIQQILFILLLRGEQQCVYFV